MLEKKIIIDATNPKLIAAAYIENGVMRNLLLESDDKVNSVGNIYVGQVSNIVESLEAYFIDYGGNKSGFLPFLSYPKQLVKDEIVIVQIGKNEKGGKGARLTGFVQISGKYNTYMPYGSKMRPNITPFVKTRQKSNLDQDEIERDLGEAKALWNKILQTQEKKPGELLHKSRSVIEKIALESYYPDVTVVINSKLHYCLLSEYIPEESLILHDSEVPIFYFYGLAQEIKSLAANKITLPCGGSIVIDHTEAMVTVDVNSSSANYGSLDESSFKINMQAATEIARQICLRKLSGIIAIDFIDMKEEYRPLVEKEFRESMQHTLDSVRISKINEFGVLMLSKKRSDFCMNEYLYEKCENFSIRTAASLGNEILWDIQLAAHLNPGQKITVECEERVATYLLNEFRGILYELEKKGVSIRILPASTQSYNISPAVIYVPQQPEKVAPNNISPLTSTDRCYPANFIDYAPTYSRYLAIVDSHMSFIGQMA